MSAISPIGSTTSTPTYQPSVAPADDKQPGTTRKAGHHGHHGGHHRAEAAPPAPPVPAANPASPTSRVDLVA